MVYLNRIYTRSGDAGETSLGDGTRVSKTSPRIKALGAVDEVNAALGVCLALGALTELASRRVQIVQNDLFDLGADVCQPLVNQPAAHPPLRVQPSQVERLEHWIDECTERLEPLKSFILPGGRPGAAVLHQARTVCRRAEIELICLHRSEAINTQCLLYLNRLSDLLFVLARIENDCGKGDVLWIPGEHR